MFHYQAYGLRLEANRPIGGLLPSEASAPVDLNVRLPSAPHFDSPPITSKLLHTGPERDPDGQPMSTLWRLETACRAGYYQLRFGKGGENVVFTLDAAGTWLWANWKETVHYDDVTSLLLRPALAAGLWLRGVTCLHASVVAIGGQAVALVGQATSGKSSLAAAFAARGQAVLADDVGALSDQGTRFLVQPAFPLLAIWPNTAAAVQADNLPRVWTAVEKRSLPLGGATETRAFRFEAQALPLCAIYFLERRRPGLRAPVIEPLAAAEGLVRLAANNYTHTRLNAEHSAREFERFGRIARQVPLRLLQRPDDLASLGSVCDAIVSDLARERRGA
ncbi:MAG: hypothetical protein ABI847_01795 [Anaerolineales bacterium]